MPEIAVNAVVHFGAWLFFGLIDAGLANKEPEVVPEPPAVVEPEPAATLEERARIQAEVDELRQFLRQKGYDPDLKPRR